MNNEYLRDATVNPGWFTAALHADPDEFGASREYCLGVLASMAPPPDVPEDEDERLGRDTWRVSTVTCAMNGPHFWRGLLDARALIGLYVVKNGKKIEDSPSLQMRLDSRWLEQLSRFLILEDRSRRRDPRHPFKPYRLDEDDLRTLSVQCDRGRLNIQGDLAQKIIWLVYLGSSVGDPNDPCSPKNSEITHDIIYGWVSRKRRKLLRRGWVENVAPRVLAAEEKSRGSAEPVILEFEDPPDDKEEERV